MPWTAIARQPFYYCSPVDESTMTSASQFNMPVWNDSYCIGSEMVDNQHRRLFDLLNQLVDAQNGRCDMAVVKHAVNSLYGYVRIHFSDEEKLMEELGYIDRDKHRQQHDQFIVAYDDLILKHLEAEDFLPRLVSFVQLWLVHHIQEEDTKIRAG